MKHGWGWKHCHKEPRWDRCEDDRKWCHEGSKDWGCHEKNEWHKDKQKCW